MPRRIVRRLMALNYFEEATAAILEMNLLMSLYLLSLEQVRPKPYLVQHVFPKLLKVLQSKH